MIGVCALAGHPCSEHVSLQIAPQLLREARVRPIHRCCQDPESRLRGSRVCMSTGTSCCCTPRQQSIQSHAVLTRNKGGQADKWQVRGHLG